MDNVWTDDAGLCRKCNKNSGHFTTEYYDYNEERRKTVLLCGACQKKLTSLIDGWLGGVPCQE